ncbi:MAG: pirin family protein [Acidobacteria bacterium]|nr:pirin family protein [Acidobacteriota bacterium]
MITLRRTKERIRTINGGQETLKSFNADNPFDPAHNGFRSLECLREEWLAPGVELEFRAPRNLEILTYVWKGALILEDPGGRKVALEMGECHRATARNGTLHRGWNGSRIETARIFQGFVTPDRSVLQTPGEKKRFSLTERRGVLKLLFSRDGRDSSLRLRQDAGVYSSILDPGHHLVHELPSGRGAWLHLVHGRIQLVDQMLVTGDGASFVGEPAVSLTAREPSEILLFDLV